MMTTLPKRRMRRQILCPVVLMLSYAAFLADAFTASSHSQPIRHAATRTFRATLPSSTFTTTTRLHAIPTDWTPLQSWQHAGFRHTDPDLVRRYSNAHGIMPDGGLSPCIIKVVGVGGGGCNAVDRMLDTTIDAGVDFYALNTDAQVLGRSEARGATTIQIGDTVTRGLGAGGLPDVGRMAAEESRKDIRTMVEGTDLCFITAGMGGGTGSGGAPVVAEIAKECGCLTVGIVTKPFAFEGRKRMNQALTAVDQLKEHVDTVIVVSNDRLLEIIPDDTPMEVAFAVADDILRQGVVGISDIIVKPGLINVDFADVSAIMKNAGTALMGIGIGSGDNAAEDAAMAAMSSPLLDSTIDNAKGVVFNISGGAALTLAEVNRAAKLIYDFVAPDANVIFGALVDETLGDSISVTVLATGFRTDGYESATLAAEAGGDSNAVSEGRVVPGSASSGSQAPPFLKTLKRG